MPVNKNWPRWILASVSKNFDDNRQGVSFFVEGDEIKAQSDENYFEFRMNGPLITEISKGYFKLEIVVNILIVSKQNKTSIHTLPTLTGIIASAFKKYIPVYKYGSTDDDDSTFLGCLLLKTTDKSDIHIANIGQVSPDIKEMQAMVQGYYCMLLEND